MHELERKLQKKESSAPILVVNMPEELESLFDGFVSPVVQTKNHKYFAMIIVFGQKMAKLQAACTSSTAGFVTGWTSLDLLSEEEFQTISNFRLQPGWIDRLASGGRFRNCTAGCHQ